MTMLNIGLLDQTMQYITEHPEDHNQGAWRCGSTGCFAYWAGVLGGGVLVDPEPVKPYWKAVNYPDRDSFLRAYASAYDGQGNNLAAVADKMTENRDAHVYANGFTEGEKREISSYAREILGLDDPSADALFSGSNSREDLRSMIEILREEGTLAGTEWAPYDEDDEDSCSECGACLCCGCDCDTEDEDEDE